MNEVKVLCAKQVAARLGVSERSAAKLLRRGEIQGFKLGGRVWRTTEEAVLEYLRRELERQSRRAA
jgi:excisionase family DNA binding protein